MIDPVKRVEFSRNLQEQRRRRGRPRRVVPTISTSVKIPTDVYDVICHIALQRRESVHKLLREAVTSYSTRHRPPDFR